MGEIIDGLLVTKLDARGNLYPVDNSRQMLGVYKPVPGGTLAYVTAFLCAEEYLKSPDGVYLSRGFNSVELPLVFEQDDNVMSAGETLRTRKGRVTMKTTLHKNNGANFYICNLDAALRFRENEVGVQLPLIGIDEDVSAAGNYLKEVLLRVLE